MYQICKALILSSQEKNQLKSVILISTIQKYCQEIEDLLRLIEPIEGLKKNQKL